ncbi:MULTISPECIES: hypothetical protein [Streptomyces]|uniref:DNA primase/polymerase bifunctional N-terminal domain-containing protein n=1 Tax=Streptomyces fradiae ATCC 10745 = DSM 40063 TaxID=1319510 RepID=A0A1Y2P1U7_STRFR|nr:MULTISPECIES: hypothetical protein [Streptomyces]OSY53724.1 hypothetical protein BG846_00594 [Streptomyces fradiae ATCC 10745 = DSM 40063]QEV15794.1 hypothetical protein CP974_16180 [Streptomyces fradiae ATCC 10745 = DSM 40063]
MSRNHREQLDWVPLSGYLLRKAGVQFDAVRLDGRGARLVADCLEGMTDGEPGPVVHRVNGRRSMYFLLPPGSTYRRPWPAVAVRFNGEAGRISYVPVPALEGDTWPLTWRFPPTEPGRFVHPLLLRSAVVALLLNRPGTLGGG